MMTNTTPSPYTKEPWLLLTVIQIAVLYFFLPAGRFHFTIFNYSMSAGYDAYKMFCYPLLTWMYWRAYNWHKPWPPSLFFLPFAVFGCVTVFVSLGSLDGYESISESAEFLLYGLFFLMLLDIPWTRTTLRWVAGVFVLGHGYLGLLALSQFVSTSSMGHIRVNGNFDHPNELGVYLVISLCLLFWLAAHARERWEKSAIYTAIALALFSAVATLSRGTYLSLIVWLSVVLWRGTAPVRKHALIYAGVVLLLILLWQPHLFLRFNTVLQNPLVSDNPPPRTEIWAYLMDTELASLPFFGVGLNRVITDRMANHIASSDGAYTLPSAHGPHNQYLAFLLTAGLIGVLVFLWIMGLTLLTAWRMPPPLSAFFTASIIGFLMQCVFEIPIPATNLPIVLLTIGAIGTCETQSPT